MVQELILLKQVNKTYFSPEVAVEALYNVDLRIHSGEFVAIVGTSGSGKSTLMNIIGCLDTPTGGSYFFEGQDVSSLPDEALSRIRNRRIGFIFQSFNLVDSLSALENVELPLLYRRVPREERRRLAKAALSQVGLSERMAHRPSQMSGGQQQRVAIARAIAASPSVILADEPTGNLDSRSGAQVIHILEQLHQAGRTVILITHDNDLATRAGRIIRVRDGHILSDRQNSQTPNPPEACTE